MNYFWCLRFTAISAGLGIRSSIETLTHAISTSFAMYTISPNKDHLDGQEKENIQKLINDSKVKGTSFYWLRNAFKSGRK